MRSRGTIRRGDRYAHLMTAGRSTSSSRAVSARARCPRSFIIGPEGKTSELVNYRVRGSHMIVDRLFAAAELRLGDGGSERRVRIVRTDGRLFW